MSEGSIIIDRPLVVLSLRCVEVKNWEAALSS